MSRADACVPFLHGHTRRCNAAGYANGRADALDEIGVAAVLSAAADLFGPVDPLPWSTEDIQHVLRDPETAESVAASLAKVRANG